MVSRTRAASEQFGRKQAGPQGRLADTQVLLNYRGSSLSKEDVGDSLEQLPERANVRRIARGCAARTFSMFDLTRGTDYVLLVYVGAFAESAQIDLLEGMTKKLKAFRGPKCRIVAICSAVAGKPHLLGATVFIDSAGEFAAA